MLGTVKNGVVETLAETVEPYDELNSLGQSVKKRVDSPLSYENCQFQGTADRIKLVHGLCHESQALLETPGKAEKMIPTEASKPGYYTYERRPQQPRLVGLTGWQFVQA
jgi:hypothetical protein